MLLGITKLNGANHAIEQSQQVTFALFVGDEDSHVSNPLSEKDLTLQSMMKELVARHLAESEDDKLLVADPAQSAAFINTDKHLRDYLRVCYIKKYQYAPFFCMPGKLSFVKSSADSSITLTINH